MLSQQNSIKITGLPSLPKSKPIDIIKKSDSFCININENNEPDEKIYDYIHNDYINVDTLGKNSKKNTNTNVCKLDTICFDPTKFSPPDDWSLRLKHRIRNYDTTNYSYINYLFDNK